MSVVAVMSQHAGSASSRIFHPCKGRLSSALGTSGFRAGDACSWDIVRFIRVSSSSSAATDWYSIGAGFEREVIIE